MSKDSSANYYQSNKERLQKKKLVKDIKVFLKKKKKKGNNILINEMKIYQKMKNKNFLNIAKNIKREKTPDYNYKKYCFKKY